MVNTTGAVRRHRPGKEQTLENINLDEEGGILLASENLVKEYSDDPDIKKCAVMVPWFPDDYVVIVTSSEWKKLIESGFVMERGTNAETEI